MARMYSRRKGSSGSKRPLKPVKPTWVRSAGKEVEMLISKLAKEGMSSSQIGLVLRDSYGIPSVRLLTGKRLVEILGEKKLAPKLPEDLVALMRRLLAIQKHAENNKQDMTAKRGYQLTESKIKRLIKYYKAMRKLPVDFKYDPKNVKLYTE